MVKEWKRAVTFSYDDGVTQDRRLVALFHKYGLKGTFNLNSELLGQKNTLIREGVQVSHNKVTSEEVAELYAGHEVAVHTLTHPNLTRVEQDAEIIRQVEQDREKLSRLAGYEVVGMAYPGGGVNCSQHIADVVRGFTGVKYARTTVCSYGFDVQSDLYQFCPTVYHVMEMEEMFRLGREFLESRAEKRQILYIWGHSYEFDIHNTWERFEEFLKLISGHENIFYGTNREVLLGE